MFIVELGLFVVVVLALLLVSTSNGTSAFGRLFSLFKSKADRNVDRRAVEDPDAVYRGAIERETGELVSIEELIKELKREEFKLTTEKEKLDSQLSRVNAAIERAAEENNAEIGAEAIKSADVLEAQIADLSARIAKFRNEGESIMSARAEQKSLVEALKREATVNKGAIKANSILEKIRNKKSAIGSREDKNLEAVRNAAYDAQADMATSKEIDGSSTEAKLEAFMNESKKDSANDRFAELVKKKAAAAGTAA